MTVTKTTKKTATKRATALTDAIGAVTKKTAKTGVPAVVEAEVVYRSIATGRVVTNRYALANPLKVRSTGTAIIKKAAPAKKTSRIVKRVKKTGEFAKKTSRGKKVTNDIVKAPVAKNSGGKAGSKVAKKVATKKAVAKKLPIVRKGGTRGG